MNLYSKFLLLLFPFWIFTQSGNTIYKEKLTEIKHKIPVHHPGKGDDNMECVELVEVQNKNGFSTTYYMNVESVICIKNVCKVVPVRIYWDNIGAYKKYELEEGVTLEKYEADFFEKEDYIKLQHVLSNENSPFKNVKVDEILTVPDETHNDVDAVSGATALELNEEDTVPGAALTCYTLWHWTYGDIQSIIRNLTGVSMSSRDFKTLLLNENLDLKLFSIEQLTATNLYKKKLVEEVIQQTSLNAKLLKSTINYFEKSPAKTYFSGMINLFDLGNKQQKIAVLSSFLNTKFQMPKGYLDSLSNRVTSFTSYQEISIFLRLMKSKNSNSNNVVKNVFPLLDSEFIIGRSVYWFLKNQELTLEEKEVLKGFQQKHKDQL